MRSKSTDKIKAIKIGNTLEYRWQKWNGAHFAFKCTLKGKISLPDSRWRNTGSSFTIVVKYPEKNYYFMAKKPLKFQFSFTAVLATITQLLSDHSKSKKGFLSLDFQRIIATNETCNRFTLIFLWYKVDVSRYPTSFSVRDINSAVLSEELINIHCENMIRVLALLCPPPTPGQSFIWKKTLSLVKQRNKISFELTYEKSYINVIWSSKLTVYDWCLNKLSWSCL